MQRKIILLILILLLMIGCENIANTPVDAVQSFFGKYQRLDKNILLELDSIISNNYNVSEKNSKEYKEIFEKQYQNLSYKIKNEEIDDDSAIVIAEIEVLNYKTSIEKAKKYYANNKTKLKKEYKIYENYKLDELKKTTDKIKYEIIFNLEKRNNEWKINELTSDDILKIHGLY